MVATLMQGGDPDSLRPMALCGADLHYVYSAPRSGRGAWVYSLVMDVVRGESVRGGGYLCFQLLQPPINTCSAPDRPWTSFTGQSGHGIPAVLIFI